MMVNQLIIESKLKELGLTIKDINFEKVSTAVLNKLRTFYFQLEKQK